MLVVGVEALRRNRSRGVSTPLLPLVSLKLCFDKLPVFVAEANVDGLLVLLYYLGSAPAILPERGVVSLKLTFA